MYRLKRRLEPWVPAALLPTFLAGEKSRSGVGEAHEIVLEHVAAKRFPALTGRQSCRILFAPRFIRHWRRFGAKLAAEKSNPVWAEPTTLPLKGRSLAGAFSGACGPTGHSSPLRLADARHLPRWGRLRSGGASAQVLVAAKRFPALAGRQSCRTLFCASLHPPPAALRRKFSSRQNDSRP